MSDWVVDKGLDVLEKQIDEEAPNRNKDSDGSKGDAAHAARDSDHNPEHPPPPGNPDNEVDARDFTHDPKNGADMFEITEAIRLSRDRRVKYVIFNDRIFSSYATDSRKPYEWGPYNPDDPNRDRHTGHAHVSVNDVHHDETQPWSIKMPFRDDRDAHALIDRNASTVAMQDTIPFGANGAPEENKLVKAIKDIQTKLAAVQQDLDAIKAQPNTSGSAPSHEDLVAAFKEALREGVDN